MFMFLSDSLCGHTLIFDLIILEMMEPFAFSEILFIGRHISPLTFIEFQALGLGAN